MTTDSPPLLAVENLVRPGLSPVSFALAAGACAVVMGPSGAGKSILLRAIADLDPHEGQVSLNGVACSTMSGPAWRAKVSYVAAEPGWWAETPVEHMASPQRGRDLLGLLGLTEAVFEGQIARLSTGQRQRLALIRALIQEPNVLLLDEPTGPLDADSRDRVADLLETKRAGGMGLLITTHDRAFAERMGDQFYHMEAGVMDAIPQ